MAKTKTSPKLISLSFGILVLLFLVGFYVFAWQEPTTSPPGGNVPSPLNVSGTAQTKTGNLTVRNLYLNPPGHSEGNIYRINQLIGYNDIFIKGNSGETAPIYLKGNQLSIYTGGTERLRITSAGRVGIGETSPNDRLEVAGNIRADRLIDRNNISYYLDPASSSILNNIDIRGSLYNGSGSHSGRVYVGDNMQVAGYLYFGRAYDADNGSYYLDPNSNSEVYKLNAKDRLCIRGVCKTSWPSGGGISCADCDSRFVNVTGDTMTGNLTVPKIYDQNSTSYYLDPNDISRLYRANINKVYAYNWMYSPVLYDTNNSSYYVDPASTSRFNCINLGGVTKCSWPSGGGLPGAGNGLYYSGDTLHVGAGTGISVGSNDVRVKNTSFSCSPGYALRYINIDSGAKICEYDDTGGGGGGCANVFDDVGTDSGTISASGCYDNLYIRGGTSISTRKSGNTVYIDYTGGGGGGGDITGVYGGDGLDYWGASSGDATLNLDTSAISSCTNSTNDKIIWDSSNKRLKCATDQTGGGGGGCANVFDDVGTDSGTISASGCYDNLYIRGGTNVSTRASGNTVYIDATGGGGGGCANVFKYVKAENTGGYATASGCSDTLTIKGDSHIDVFRSGNDISIKYTPETLHCTTYTTNIGAWGTKTDSCPAGYQRTGCNIWGCSYSTAHPEGDGCRYRNGSCGTSATGYIICCKVY